MTRLFEKFKKDQHLYHLSYLLLHVYHSFITSLTQFTPYLILTWLAFVSKSIISLHYNKKELVRTTLQLEKARFWSDIGYKRRQGTLLPNWLFEKTF